MRYALLAAAAVHGSDMSGANYCRRRRPPPHASRLTRALPADPPPSFVHDTAHALAESGKQGGQGKPAETLVVERKISVPPPITPKDVDTSKQYGFGSGAERRPESPPFWRSFSSGQLNTPFGLEVEAERQLASLHAGSGGATGGVAGGGAGGGLWRDPVTGALHDG